MRTRTLLISGTIALTGLLLTAGIASAQVEISEEANGSGHCSEVVEIGAHEIAGGCHIEVEGEISLWVHPPAAPAETIFTLCHVDLEGFVGEDGAGYFTRQTIVTHDTPGVPCTRDSCDEADHTQLLWPIQMGAGSIETAFCLRGAGVAEGTAPTLPPCHIILERTETSDHQYEYGHDDDSHQFCENLPVSIKGHLITEEGSGEAVEINDL